MREASLANVSPIYYWVDTTSIVSFVSQFKNAATQNCVELPFAANLPIFTSAIFGIRQVSHDPLICPRMCAMRQLNFVLF